MKTTVIIDSIIASKDSLSTIISRYCPFIQIIGYSSNVIKGMEMVDYLKPEIVMATHDGLTIQQLDLLLRPEMSPQHIFVKNILARQVESEKVSSFHKPYAMHTILPLVNSVYLKLSEDALHNKMNDLITKKNANGKIALQTIDGLMLISHNDIVEVKADRAYSYIKLLSGKELFVTKPIKELELMLSNRTFFRSHKSHLLNINHLRSYKSQDGGYALMSNGVQVPVSRRKRTIFISKMKNFSGGIQFG